MERQQVTDSYAHWMMLRRLAYGLGIALIALSALSIVSQTIMADLLPPPDGFVQTQAVVTTTLQRGTFHNPSFSVTLAYEVVDRAGHIEALRSGQRVPFEVYNALSEDDVVTVYYDPDDVYNWRLESSLQTRAAAFFMIEFLMMVAGALLVALPALLRHGLRMDDFDFNRDLNITHG